MDKKMLKRTRFFISIVMIIFIILSSRLAYLQIIQYDYYWVRAEKNRLRIMPITAPRGEIFDSSGRQLVTNRPGFTVSLVDLGKGYSAETISRLSGLLDMEEREIREKIQLQFYRRYLPIRLKTDIDMETVAQISEHRLELPGVLIEVQPIRNYVLDDFAPHIVGYLGEGTVHGWVAEHWEENDYHYQPGDLVGQAGLEMVWEPFLRGNDGGLQVEVNSTGQAIREFERVDPEPGYDLHLTIDAELQLKVQEALQEAVQKQLEEENNLYAGEAAAVMLDPHSGRILAMASIPSFNPNTFRQDFPELARDARRPLVNKAIEEHYPGGSAYKMVTSIAALEEGVVSRNERVHCPGTITRYGATKSCFRGHAHGRISIFEAIQKSCNIFFFEMGLRLGIDNLAYYSRQFGFGNQVGLNDVFGEKKGIVASREYKRSVYNEPWYPAETMDTAIGQSYQSNTMLQMANYTAMIANGGKHYRPYLVERVVDGHGQTVMMAEPELVYYMDVSESNWETVRTGMSAVTLPGGTAARLADLPVSIAGKTGTAQVVGMDRDIPPHSLFVAYAPVEAPEVALAVIVKHGGTGGATAVPVAREILMHYFGLEEEVVPEEHDLQGEEVIE